MKAEKKLFGRNSAFNNCTDFENVFFTRGDYHFTVSALTENINQRARSQVDFDTVASACNEGHVSKLGALNRKRHSNTSSKDVLEDLYGPKVINWTT